MHSIARRRLGIARDHDVEWCTAMGYVGGGYVTGEVR